jgi:hypothetical protein
MTATNARRSRSRSRSLQLSFVHSEPDGAARAGRARRARQHARRHGSRFIPGAMAIGLAGRRSELVLEAAPLRAGPPIRSGNPGGSARVDPAVQHLVAFPQLLPLEFLEPAARRHGHQLFGDQLLDPFGFRAAREMDEARWGGGTRGDVFIRGSGKPERAIGLGLEGRDGDRPKPRTTADLAAAFRRIDKARAGDRRGPAVLLPGPLWRCGQQPLRPKSLCFSEVVQACLPA